MDITFCLFIHPPVVTFVAFTFMLYAFTFIVNNAMNMGMAKISL